jgi:alpha-tubulin suppressor-like RCC1 family protein
MPRVKNVALLLCLCAAPTACNDAPDNDPTAPEIAPADPTINAAMTTPLAFRQISAGTGSGHSCGVATSNLAYCWGYNGTGAIGDGTTTRRLRPVAVAGTLRFQQVSAGYDFTCGVTTEFRAYCWGSNNFGIHGGQLGDGTKTQRLRPVAVRGGLLFSEVSTGQAHTCGRTTGNRVYCWGSNERGQIGDGTRQDRLTPVPIGGTLRFRQVSVGWNHSCAVTTDDRAYCWGGSVLNPTVVPGGHRFLLGDGGGFHTCGVATDNRGLCWGDNLFGQLGNGTTGAPRAMPRVVVGGLAFRAIEAGAHHTCGVTTVNQAYCWGNNQEGTLGDGTTTHRSAPVRVAGGHRFSQVSAGGAHSCGRKPSGAGYCWGGNFSGALGDGTRTNRLTPRAVVGPS